MEFYPVTAAYKTLKCAVASMVYGQLTANHPDEISEVLGFFKYQGIAFYGPEREMFDGKAIRQAPSGVCFQRHAEQMGEKLKHVCELIAMNLASWPRLESTQTLFDGSMPSFTCSPTTAWVAFARKPQVLPDGAVPVGGDASRQAFALAQRKATWLMM